MESIQFPESCCTLGEHQQEYKTLHCHDDNGIVTACFQLTSEEIEKIATTGIIWFQQLTYASPFQPVKLLVDKPELGQ